MRKMINILSLCLVSITIGVAASPVTVKPHLATDLAVSKTSNEVVINTVPSVDMVYNYEASEVIIYCNQATPATEVGAEAKALFAENRTVSRTESNDISYKHNRKTKPIYLFVCSIRQCGFGALIRSVKI